LEIANVFRRVCVYDCVLFGAILRALAASNLRTSSAACAILTVIVSNIPAHAAGPGGDLFPLKAGYWWTYKVTDSKGKSESIKYSVVSAKAGKNGSNVFKVSAVGGKETSSKVYSKQGGRTALEGIEFAGKPVLNEHFVPPKLVVDSKVQTGSVWQWGGTRNSPDIETERWQVFPVEKVNVPAGEFNCVRIGGLSTKDSKAHYRTRWFAPNVGMVKEVDLLDSDKSIHELAAYHAN